MRFVERDPITNKVVGHYANPQPGYAEEGLPDDHPDIIAFLEEREELRAATSSQTKRLLENLSTRIDRIEKFLNFPIEGGLKETLKNVKVRGRG